MLKPVLLCLVVVLTTFPSFILSADEVWHAQTLLKQLFDLDNAQKIKNFVPKLLYRAIISGNLDVVNLILDYPKKHEAFKNELERTMCRFSNMSYKDERPLYTAIKMGSTEIIKSLLDHGGDPNFRHEGRAIFEWAWDSNSKLVEVLIKCPKLDLKFLGSGQTILEYAADKESLEHVRLLLTSKAADTFSKQELNFALKRSCFYGWLDIVKSLLDKKFKVDINFPDEYGETAINIAAIWGKWDIVKEFIITRGDEIDLNAWDKYGMNILHRACVYGNLGTVKFLLDKKLNMDINCQNADGESAIQLAAARKKYDIVRELIISRGNVIDLNVLDGAGMNILHYASQSGDLETVKLLLDKSFNVDINCQTTDGITPIYLAVSAKEWEIMKEFIINRGEEIELNNLNGYGMNILHYACWNGDLEAVKLLLDKSFNVDINCQTTDGITSIYLAARSQNLELLHYLFNKKDLDMHKDLIERSFDLALEDNLVDLLSALLSSGRITLENVYLDKLRSWFQNKWPTLKMKSDFFFNSIMHFLKLDATILDEINRSIYCNALMDPKLEAFDIGEKLVNIFEVVSKFFLRQKSKTRKFVDYEMYMFSEAIKYLVEKVMKSISKNEIGSFLLEEKEGSKLSTNQRKMPDQIKVRFGKRFSTIVRDENLKIPDEERALFDKLFHHVATDDAKIVLISKLMEVGLVLNGPTGLIEDKGERDWYINRYITHYRWVLDKMPELCPFLFSELIDPKFTNKDKDVKEVVDLKDDVVNVDDDVMDMGNNDVDGNEGAMDVKEEGWVEDGSNTKHIGIRKRRRETPKPEHEHGLDRPAKRRREEPKSESDQSNRES